MEIYLLLGNSNKNLLLHKSHFKPGVLILACKEKLYFMLLVAMIELD